MNAAGAMATSEWPGTDTSPRREGWLAAALESLGDAVIAADERGRIVFLNHAAETLTGWTGQEAAGLEVEHVLHVVQCDVCPEDEWTPTAPQQVLLVTRGGTETPVSIRAAPIRDLSGQPCGMVFALNDITPFVAAYQALCQHNQDLETNNRELDAFAHTVAHDIKDILSTMITHASMLEEAYDELTDAQRQKFVQIIVRHGRKACNIVDELLMLAAVRNVEVQRSPLDMAEIVARAEQRVARLKRDRRAEIHSPACWPVAWGYEPWIEEVWVNYLSNGIKYGGTPPQLYLGATVLPDGMVRFWVRDNGAGIQAADQSRLFTPFTQLHRTRAKGHGLGLSIVRRIVERLDGQVGIESQAGQGSTFSFTLPAAPAAC